MNLQFRGCAFNTFRIKTTVVTNQRKINWSKANLFYVQTVDPSLRLSNHKRYISGVILFEISNFKFSPPPPGSFNLGKVRLNWEQISTAGLGYLMYISRRVIAPRRENIFQQDSNIYSILFLQVCNLILKFSANAGCRSLIRQNQNECLRPNTVPYTLRDCSQRSCNQEIGYLLNIMIPHIM